MTRRIPVQAADLAPLVYDQLRALAHRYMKRERRGHVLQPTALVHEAYLRLVAADQIDWQGKTHFLAVAATEMRRILVEQARAAAAGKRGARLKRITLHDGLALTPEPSLELLALDQALRGLARRSPRQSRIAELRLFAGLRVSEAARVVGISERTVKLDWQVARAYLARELRSAGRDAP